MTTPFVPPANDQERLIRMLQTLCNLPADTGGYNAHAVVQALNAAGITEFEGQFAMLLLRQIKTLAYDQAGTARQHNQTPNTSSKWGQLWVYCSVL